MQINVTYNDTDVAKVLATLIKHPNAEEFVKLLSPMICASSQAVNHMFKLMLNDKLPEVLPVGTLCYVYVKNLGYGVDKDAMLKSHFANTDGKIIAKIKEFKGYHEYSQYMLEFTMIDTAGIERKDTSYLNMNDIEEIVEL